MANHYFQFSMRLLLVIVAVSAIAVRFWPETAQIQPDEKWAKLFSSADRQPLANIPVIESPRTIGKQTQITVRNMGSTTLQYYSAGPENISLYQEVYTDREWTMANWSWCGTGKSQFEIAPTESAELVVSYWDDNERERMLGLFTEKNTNRFGLVVLCEEPEDDSAR